MPPVGLMSNWTHEKWAHPNKLWCAQIVYVPVKFRNAVPKFLYFHSMLIICIVVASDITIFLLCPNECELGVLMGYSRTGLLVAASVGWMIYRLLGLPVLFRGKQVNGLSIHEDIEILVVQVGNPLNGVAKWQGNVFLGCDEYLRWL